MELPEVFDAIVPSVVALGLRIPQPLGREDFAKIEGTGFVVNSRGVVMTAGHVVRTLMDAEHKAFAIPYEQPALGEGTFARNVTLVDISHFSYLSSFRSLNGPFYGGVVPDVGFVQMAVRGIPDLDIAVDPNTVKAGVAVAFAGYPLGSTGLAWTDENATEEPEVSQVMPYLRHGIISSVFPFPCPHPSGFTIDALSQGGASGSPIIPVDRPAVLGMLCSALHPTNTTICLPGHVLKGALDAAVSSGDLDGDPQLTVHQWRAQAQYVRPFRFAKAIF